VEEETKNIFAEERELLHKQLQLLAEKSNESCSPEALVILSEQMVKVYTAINPY